MSQIIVQKLHTNAKIPTKTYQKDTYDLYSFDRVIIKPGEIVKVKTGIALNLGDNFALIHDRSSLGSNGIHVLAGRIDPTYLGEIIVVLCNLNLNKVIDSILYSMTDPLTESPVRTYKQSCYEILPGDRIAQLNIFPYVYYDMIEGEVGSSDRSDKGFGSTGV